MPTRLSVVLSTFNRAASLRRALAALLDQTADPAGYEIVVVDNNSTDDTAAAVASRQDSRLRLVREPRQGLSFARNTGIAAARGEVIAFTDDDVEVRRDWVERLLAVLDEVPGADGAGGRVLPRWEQPPPAWLTREHWAPLALQDHGGERRLFDLSCPLGLVGASLAFRRTVFDRIGTFAPDVQRVGDGVGSTEDHELLARLYAAGGRMVYEPSAVVVAPVSPERCETAYHRRWHEGHGRFHARMRQPAMERSRWPVLGIPGHLLRSGLADAAIWAGASARGDRERALAAELRLRFLRGFAAERRRSRRPAGRPGPIAAGPAVPGAVTVIIPCYNHARFLAEAIRSVAPDAGREADIVVVDDGSTDGSSAVAARFPQVRCVRQANRGLAAARNRGLAEARGEFVVFLDADDRLLPGGLEIGAAALERHPGCAMAFGRCLMMDEEGCLLPTPPLAVIDSGHHRAFLRTNPIWMPGAAMFRRDVVARLGGFREGFDAAADYDLYLRLVRTAAVHDHGEPVAAYRQHGSNMSGSASRMLHDTLAVMRQHRPAGRGPLLDAWREGRLAWKTFYGTHLVEEIRRDWRARACGAFCRRTLTLASRHPRLALREAWRKLRRAAAGPR